MVYGPNEGNGEDRIWIENRMKTGITGAFGVPGENDNGRRVVEFCVQRGLCVGNTYFEQRSSHKSARVARGQDRDEVKSMIDLVLCHVQDKRDGAMLYCVKSSWWGNGLRGER